MWTAISADTGLKDFRLNRLDAATFELVPQNVEYTATNLFPNRKVRTIAIVREIMLRVCLKTQIRVDVAIRDTR